MALKKGQGVHHGSLSGPVSMLAGQQLCQMKCVGAGYGLHFISLSDSTNLDPQAVYIAAFTEAVTLFMSYCALMLIDVSQVTKQWG